VVRENQMWDAEAGELVTVSEGLTGLARIEMEERKLLDAQFAAAVRLGLEERSQAERERSADLQADLVRAALEEAGLDWSAENTRRIAQRALLRVYRTE
jgi:hypothetical protein